MVMNLADWELFPTTVFRLIRTLSPRAFPPLPATDDAAWRTDCSGEYAYERVCPHSFLHGHALVMKKGQACHEMHYEPNWTAPVIAMLTGDGARRIRHARRVAGSLPDGSELPYRLDFFDDEIDSLRVLTSIASARWRK